MWRWEVMGKAGSLELVGAGSCTRLLVTHTLKRSLSDVLNSGAMRCFTVQLKGWSPVLVRILLCHPLLAVHF